MCFELFNLFSSYHWGSRGAATHCLVVSMLAKLNPEQTSNAIISQKYLTFSRPGGCISCCIACTLCSRTPRLLILFERHSGAFMPLHPCSCHVLFLECSLSALGKSSLICQGLAQMWLLHTAFADLSRKREEVCSLSCHSTFFSLFILVMYGMFAFILCIPIPLSLLHQEHLGGRYWALGSSLA